MQYASVADLPLEICDHIVGICEDIGGPPLLWKCIRVHNNFIPSVYSVLFRNISFSSTLPFADDYREHRISLLIDILRGRPLISHLIKQFTLQLHKNNNWLVHGKASRFLELLKLLQNLGARPLKLCLSKLPGISFVDCNYWQHKFREKVIVPFFALTVRSLTVMWHKNLCHDILSSFTSLDEVIFDSSTISWNARDARYWMDQYHTLKLPHVCSLHIRRCVEGEGVSTFFNPWCGLPFQLSALRELECPLERASDAILLNQLQNTIKSTPSGSQITRVHLRINVNQPHNRKTLGTPVNARICFICRPHISFHFILDYLDFANSPHLNNLRVTLKIPLQTTNKPLPDCQPYVDSLALLLYSPRCPPSLQQFAIDFLFVSDAQCRDTIRFTQWETLLRRQQTHQKSQQYIEKIDCRINFIMCGHVLSPDGALSAVSHVSYQERAANYERYFPGWHVFAYEPPKHDVCRVVKNFVYFSAHSTWAYPASHDENKLIYEYY
ncbi:hypothetical protein BJ165DRAFT_1417791 [Panaeolus papilionaceus]|nr:hypothetical protein BJ165DRAFT_1417791 [Panaeolus papilionaceus]